MRHSHARLKGWKDEAARVFLDPGCMSVISWVNFKLLLSLLNVLSSSAPPSERESKPLSSSDTHFAAGAAFSSDATNERERIGGKGVETRERKRGSNETQSPLHARTKRGRAHMQTLPTPTHTSSKIRFRRHFGNSVSERCTGWSIWIKHRKFMYSIPGLIDVILNIQHST